MTANLRKRLLLVRCLMMFAPIFVIASCVFPFPAPGARYAVQAIVLIYFSSALILANAVLMVNDLRRP